MTTRVKACVSCESGMIRPANLRGRKLDYRDEAGLLFDSDLEVPTCDSCGELYLNAALTKQFSETMERLRLDRKQRVVERFVAMADRRYPQVTRAAWEDMFGLSRGYLSRLESGARVADTALEILLDGFARDPEAALRLVEITGHLPHTIRVAVLGKRASGKKKAAASG